MRIRPTIIVYIVVVLAVIMAAAGCTNQSQATDTANTSDNQEKAAEVQPVSNENIMKKYIADFLTDGFTKYYRIDSIESQLIKQDVKDNQLEAVFFTKMLSCNITKHPDTIPYIKEAKEKADKETDPQKKLALQQQYLTLYSEYLKPSASNFEFKLAAEIKDGKIDKNTIQIFTAIDENQGVRYEPAEKLLPKK